jgi:ribosomal protein L37AE/L43A
MIDAVIEELKTHQTQLDQDGVMVGVSRQALEELLAHVAAPAHPAPIAGLEPGCPFCGRDPFHRIDNGIGMEAVAVTCCDLGDLFFRGARAAPSEVTLSWEEFMEIGHKIAVLRMSAAQLEAHAAEQVRAERREFTCAARKQSLPEPADCDWPVCGCDPYADKVIAALEESGALKDQSQHPSPIAGLEPGCPFCGRDPFHRIDNGIGMEAVAVTCCDLGDLFFRGARAAPSEVTLSWEEFMEIGHKIAVLRMSAAQLEAHAAEQVRAEREAWQLKLQQLYESASRKLRDTSCLMSNPPQNSAVWDIRNEIAAIRARGQV